jgi:hypothetical protein
VQPSAYNLDPFLPLQPHLMPDQPVPVPMTLPTIRIDQTLSMPVPECWCNCPALVLPCSGHGPGAAVQPGGFGWGGHADQAGPQDGWVPLGASHEQGEVLLCDWDELCVCALNPAVCVRASKRCSMNQKPA